MFIANDGRPLRPGDTDRDAKADCFGERRHARHGGAKRRLIFQMQQTEPQRQRAGLITARQLVALDETKPA
ncbi:hypothetical protein ABIE53_004495 [Burkholderia sp. OAS925]